MTKNELNDLGFRSQEEWDAWLANSDREQKLCRAALRTMDALSDAEYIRFVDAARTEHPEWWSYTEWLGRLKWEMPFRANAAMLRHYLQVNP